MTREDLMSVRSRMHTCKVSLCLALLVLLPQLWPTNLWGDDWTQFRGNGRDGRWNETGIRDDLPDGQLEPVWSFDIGPGYSGPTVSEGRVFVTDRKVEGAAQSERVLCLDSTTGKLLWNLEYPAPYEISYKAGPRASVTIDGAFAYAVGAMGHFHCLRVADGSVVWKRDLNQEYNIAMPIWGISAAPLIYGELVIQQVSGSDGACMVAFEKGNGKEKWRALKERAGYSSPIVVKQAGKDVLVCWTGDSLSGLDPSTGTVYWARPFPPSRMPIGIASPVMEGELLYVSSFYDGSLMLRLPKDRLAMEEVWREVGKDEEHTKALHSMIGTPFMEGGYIYGVDSHGEMRCLDAKTGTRIWEDLTAVPKARWSTIHMVRNQDKHWLFNERGELLIARFSPKGLEILDRCKVIEPTREQLGQRGGVCWTHPAYAEKAIFVRNDQRILKASLAK